ncbi:glycosyltransferase family 4 protein [Cryobacterium arcticum]|uniref:D-inositol 3-phosphate glycosyltransferase n=1 Tax=Cryobacterium arcticum TaxID=670052 RepID=A0A317ZNR3_9MICO|nr:glycosyltransferase family 4 protein [Cryobacterium arcticum]PXA65721.1 group 1 glycosyl transferase [Cryobacterium arcticum]
MIPGRPAVPLRILYSFPHTLGAPGIGMTALNQVSGLRAAGADVTVVCTAVDASVGAFTAARTLTVRGHRLPHRVFGSADAAFRYHDRRARAMLASGAYDVVHTWPLGALATLRAARARGVLGTREAPNSHTAAAYAIAGAESRRLGLTMDGSASHRPNPRRLGRELEEYAAADLILVPSEHVRQSFLTAGVPDTNLARHQYGFDPLRFTPAGRLDRAERAFTAVFLGSAEPRKGLHYALEAWHSSGAATSGTLLVAGSFAPGYRETLRPLLVHPSVRVLGFVNDTAALLRSADVLLLPSLEEGSALVTYEAQACGCVPLVSTASGALVTDGVEGLLHGPGDVAALADQIRRVSTDAALLAALRTNAIAGSAGKTWAAAGERMLAVLVAARISLRPGAP